MSLYMRQNRRGMGDVLAASFSPAAMRTLISSQRASMMQAIQQGMSDPTAYDPGYGAFEPVPASSGMSTTGLVIAGAVTVSVLGLLGYAVYRRRRGA